MNIVINPDLQETLTRLAAARPVSEEEFVTHYLESFLRSQQREAILLKIQGDPTMLKRFAAAVESTKVDLDAEEAAKPSLINPN